MRATRPTTPEHGAFTDRELDLVSALTSLIAPSVGAALVVSSQQLIIAQLQREHKREPDLAGTLNERQAPDFSDTAPFEAGVNTKGFRLK